MTNEAWQPLYDELEAWASAGLVASLWWRDDDAIAPTAALDQMLRTVNRYQVPLGLAVIPAAATEALAQRLGTEGLVDVLQHGFIHKNYSPPGARACEYGFERSIAVRLAELADGRRRLQGFARLAPIFVPPWNRYDVDLAPGLTGLGMVAISAFGPAKKLASPLIECNCHVDIISWRTTRAFAGVDKTVRQLSAQLLARRSGQVPMHQAIGLLSHHLAHDDGCWAFLEALFAGVAGHAAVRWVRPMQAVMDGARQ